MASKWSARLAGGAEERKPLPPTANASDCDKSELSEKRVAASLPPGQGAPTDEPRAHPPDDVLSVPQEDISDAEVAGGPGGAAETTRSRTAKTDKSVQTSNSTRSLSHERGSAGPPDDPAAHRIRQRLLRWGGPRLWPALPAVGIGRGGAAWSTWLWIASVDRLACALSEAYGSGIPEATEPELLAWAARSTGGVADEDDEPAEPSEGPSYPLPGFDANDPLAVTADRCVLCAGPVAPPNRAVCAVCCRPARAAVIPP